jgi:3-hydroxyisobutyrate dehydrogenase-like beta-hydroxyacid dehydrogenase
MGRAIAARLHRAGLLAAVQNRTWETSRRLAADLDVRACRTVAELAQSSQIIVTVLSDADALSAVYDGPAGLLRHLRPHSLCLEMSTVGPDAVIRLGASLTSVSCALLDAPVSGSIDMAAAGELTILVGGAAVDLQRARPAFDALGSHTFHVGALGAGATIKLAVNNVIYGLNQSVAESLVLAEQAGIEREQAYEIFASSAAAAPFVHYRRSLFEHPGREPVQMRLGLAVKDLILIEALARDVRATLPQAATNLSVLQDAVTAGLGADDVSAVAEHLRRGVAQASEDDRPGGA